MQRRARGVDERHVVARHLRVRQRVHGGLPVEDDPVHERALHLGHGPFHPKRPRRHRVPPVVIVTRAARPVQGERVRGRHHHARARRVRPTGELRDGGVGPGHGRDAVPVVVLPLGLGVEGAATPEPVHFLGTDRRARNWLAPRGVGAWFGCGGKGAYVSCVVGRRWRSLQVERTYMGRERPSRRSPLPLLSAAPRGLGAPSPGWMDRGSSCKCVATMVASDRRVPAIVCGRCAAVSSASMLKAPF